MPKYADNYEMFEMVDAPPEAVSRLRDISAEDNNLKMPNHWDWIEKTRAEIAKSDRPQRAICFVRLTNRRKGKAKRRGCNHAPIERLPECNHDKFFSIPPGTTLWISRGVREDPKYAPLVPGDANPRRNDDGTIDLPVRVYKLDADAGLEIEVVKATAQAPMPPANPGPPPNGEPTEPVQPPPAASSNEEVPPPPPQAAVPPRREGAPVEKTVTNFQRNREARQECLDLFGYKCQVCSMDFEEVYGDLGKKFIHVHHRTCLADQAEEHDVVAERDLVPVCPNCHAMLHRGPTLMEVEKLKELYESRNPRHES